MHAPLDLLVAGAGPAGTATALTAAGHGLSVLVCDKASFPRTKTCGDGLTAHALRLLERLGVPAAAVTAPEAFVPVREAVVVSPSGRRVHLPLPADGLHAGVVQRSHLDAALVAHARDRGLAILEGVGVDDVAAGADGVKATLSDGSTVEARHLVAADGHWSTVRRVMQASPGRDLGEWHALRQYWRGVDDDRLWVLFDRRVLPGYAWVFPLPDGRANVGFGVPRHDGRSGREHNALWRDLLESPGLRGVLGPRAEPEGPARAWPIPARFDPERLVEGPVLFVGDAAGVVDPLTGEGIAQALETGMLAARAVAAGGDGDTVARRYRKSVEDALARDLWFARVLQRVLRTPRRAEWCGRIIDATPWTRRNFGRWMFEDYPRAILLTPRRWRRRMLTPPGAFLPQ